MEDPQLYREPPCPMTYWLPLAQARFAHFVDDGSYLKLTDLQGEFKALAEVARLARQYWNFVVPVARLPDDVLLYIFEVLKHECHEAFLEITNCKIDHKEQELAWNNRTSWMSVAQVCQRWRQVSLGCSMLWDIVYIGVSPASSDVLVDDILARSHCSFLDVKACLKNIGGCDELQNLSAQFTRLKEHAHRFQRLTLDHQSAELFFLTPSLPTFPALESLSLVTPDFLLSSFGELSFPEFDVGDRLPRLRSLRIHGVCLNGAPIQTFDSITVFHFSADIRCGAFYQWHQSDSLFDIIKAMPRLEDLRVTNAFPSIPYRESVRPVDLPVSTRSITLEATDDDCALQCMAFSQMLVHATAKRHMTIVLPVCDTQHSETFLGAYLGRSRAPRRVHVEFDPLKTHGRISTRYADTSNPGADSGTDRLCDFLLDFDVRCYDRARDAQQICRALQLVRDSVCTDELAHVKLWGARGLAHDETLLDDTWAALGGRQVTSVLSVGAAAAESLVRVLGRAPAYPRLERVHFARCAGEDDPVRYCIERLLELARERRARGVPVREVRIPEGVVDEEFLAELREVVDDVAWA
ncbi:hypothetical protein K488DRAFT_73561 [Vararia minispora EC-137]|uniref:Uncharacterized protein n=1 Tax=Vararia minispora EC-137 TaxID=1314806 RepID=A0ACB8QAK4_9AGAM|nr:hypothetical protein K488DRAFT_73561 [Vararia minispora EC-137]